MVRRWICDAFSTFFSSVPWLSFAKNWPQFRGPNAQGVTSETNLPTEWSDTTNVKWKIQPPGQGFSSPIIWGDKLFVTSFSGYGEAHREIRAIRLISCVT